MELNKENIKSAQIVRSEVELGQTYPVYGVITAILDEELPVEGESGYLTLELNKSIKVHLQVSSQKNLDTIKERILETGIFVGQVESINPQISLRCKTVIFGKRPQLNS